MPTDYNVMRESAIADAYALLAMLVEHPSLQLAEGLASGALLRDAEAIAQEAGMGCEWSDIVSACSFDETDAADAEELYRSMRVEHTRLFEHPVKPVVYPYEGQFLYEAKQARLQEQNAAREKCSPVELDAVQPLAMPANHKKRSAMLRKEDLFDERPRMFVNPAALDAERCYREAGLKRSDAKNIPGDSIVTELQFMSHLHTVRARAMLEGCEDAAMAVDAQVTEFEAIHLRKWAKEFFESVEQNARIDVYLFVGKLGSAFFAWRLEG